MSYVTIQDWMLEFGLPMRETVLYAVIYGFSQDGESKCYATQDYLCRWMQCTTPTLHKALNGLIERGLIVKEQPNSHGKCSYVAVARYKETLDQYKETLHRGYKEALPNNKDTENIVNSKDTYNGFEKEFAAVWELYPKKEGRKRALIEYIAARRKGVSAEVIRDGVVRYAAQVKEEQTPPQYIKQGGNWFAAHRWEDQHIPQNAKPTNEGRKGKKPNRALNYMHGDCNYTDDELRARGISLGEEMYE